MLRGPIWIHSLSSSQPTVNVHNLQFTVKISHQQPLTALWVSLFTICGKKNLVLSASTCILRSQHPREYQTFTYHISFIFLFTSFCWAVYKHNISLNSKWVFEAAAVSNKMHCRQYYYSISRFSILYLEFFRSAVAKGKRYLIHLHTGHYLSGKERNSALLKSHSQIRSVPSHKTCFGLIPL